MAYLVAQGPDSRNRWRQPLTDGRVVVLGRSSGPWPVSWDSKISREHVEIVYRNGALEVRPLPTATNPVFWRGEMPETFSIQAGDHFVIGDTSFTLVDEALSVASDFPQPTQQRTFSAEYLKRLAYRDSAEKIRLLGDLPDLIKGAANDQELCEQIGHLLRKGIPHATVIALLQLPEETPGGVPLSVFHWSSREGSALAFRPSSRLIRQAVETEESVLYRWDMESSGQESQYTISGGMQWAFCTPVPGPACPGWTIYVAGTSVDAGPAAWEDRFEDDLKFAELVASTWGALREARMLEQRTASLRQFFSPIVLDALGGQAQDQVLRPRETWVSVLFCDLRGFTQRSEQSADNLLGLLQRVSLALGVATRHILKQGGVVGDFHGDAVMGFWGWPLSQPDGEARACLAALDIWREFEAAKQTESAHPLRDFRLGIGIATGAAVAGKIGTEDQVKVTVFGPVVNLAARLESMTKKFKAGILLDEETSAHAEEELVPHQARMRRLAVVRPLGSRTNLLASELLPPLAEFPSISDEDIHHYHLALESWRKGDWEEAFQFLHRVTAEDRVKDFLTVYIAQHDRQPPESWDGAIHLTSK